MTHTGDDTNTILLVCYGCWRSHDGVDQKVIDELEENSVVQKKTSTGRYLLAAMLGAAFGAIAVAIATRAIPAMMSGMKTKMMQYMGGEDFNPEEM
jgi:hypothetical protein